MNANSIVIVVLIVITVLMTIKNAKQIKEYKKDKAYIDLYTKVLRGEEGVNEELEAYIAKEVDPCLNTKAKIVKAYNDLLNGKNPSEYIKDIDVKNIYYVNDKFSIEKAKLNSEIFVWLTLMLSKARCLSMIDLMNNLYAKVNAYEEDLKVLVEYQTFKSAYNSLLEKGTEPIEFLKKLLSGDYGEYVYDKNLIGIYKKIACCLLVFTGEPIDENDEAMLPEFTTTLVGNRFTRDLEIYDKYAPKTEDLSADSDTKEEENKETEDLKDNVEETSEEIKEEASEKLEKVKEETEVKAEAINEETKEIEESMGEYKEY